MKAGDSVTVLDTSNDRHREGVVRRVIEHKEGWTEAHVWVPRFNRIFVFRNGETNLGRFKLIGLEN